MKNQRLLFFSTKAFDMADEDKVIAAWVMHLVAALEPGATTGNKRCAARADDQIDTGKPVALVLRKTLR